MLFQHCLREIDGDQGRVADACKLRVEDFCEHGFELNTPRTSGPGLKLLLSVVRDAPDRNHNRPDMHDVRILLRGAICSRA